tara:strand:- start:103 stop:537 length:435 start_codon:yes stop_codon:yes gene_type:complete
MLRLACTAVFLVIGAAISLTGCGEDVGYNSSSPSPRLSDGAGRQSDAPLFIHDRSGKSWDVTHALNYNMEPAGFECGLGPFAILPILDPEMLSPDDQGYPSRNSSFRVMGTDLNGFARAYPINVMSWHEVANEQFGETHVAVAY